MTSIMKAWFLLFRPWSYTATLIPFLVTAGFFIGTKAVGLRWSDWGLGLLAGLCLQATVNLLNTWGDEKSGVDDVPGAIRTTPQVHDGDVSMRGVFVAALACAAIGVVLGGVACVYSSERTYERVALGEGIYLNFPAVVAGFVGILGATNYSTGVKFKYRGLGVPFVSFLMGPLEIFAAAALIKPEIVSRLFWGMLTAFGDGVWAWALVIAAFFCLTLPVASLVGVIMHGNDMRDIPSDRAAGIVTLASRLGPKGALLYYRIAHVVPYAVCLLLSAFIFACDSCSGRLSFAGALISLPLLCLPLTIKTLRAAGRVYEQNPASPPWRGLERASGLIHLVFGVLYASALALFAVMG